MTKVFVLEEVRDFKMGDLDRYGDLVFIFPRNTRDVSIWSEKFCSRVLDRLTTEGYDPESDLFCVNGYMVPLIKATVALIEEYGTINVLFWNAKDREYVKEELGLGFEAEL